MYRRILFVLCCALLFTACAPAVQEPSAAPAPTSTDTPTETATSTLARPTRHATLPPEPTATPSLTPSMTNTHVTATFIPTTTKIPTSTPTFTPSLTATRTPTPSATPTISFTPQANSAIEQQTPLSGRPFAAHFHTVMAGRSVGFMDTSYGSAVAWAWDFGDGTTSDWRSPNHRYADAGRYVVTLMISDAAGRKSSAVRAIIVEIETCLVGTGRQVLVRRDPSASSQAVYMMTPNQTWPAVAASIDDAGTLWYRLEGGGWLNAAQVYRVEGICPTPPVD